MTRTAGPAQLKQSTLIAYSDHIGKAEAEMSQTLHGERAFLWSDCTSERAERLRQEHTIAQLYSEKHPVKVPDGLIHDWIGATRIPNTTLEKTLALVQDYDNHKNMYTPEVIDSRLLRHRGHDFQIYLRLLKKKIITVVLDTTHDVHYSSLHPTRWLCRSYTTRIAEVEDAGKPTERSLSPDSGYGFLWRLYSYWRFEQKKRFVYIECRAISLTRDVPTGLGWLIEPIIEKLPRESLIATLELTRIALS